MHNAHHSFHMEVTMECSHPEGVPPEVQRRLRLLGPLASASYDYHDLKARAALTYVPLKVLWTWWQAYQKQREEGLAPTNWTAWTALPAKTQQVIIERLAKLGKVVTTCAFPDECDLDSYIPELAQLHQWSLRTAERWVRRYQVGGWWGLAPEHDPAKAKRKEQQELVPALGALDEKALEETFRRRELLGALATKRQVSRAEVEERAEAVGLAPRTVWHYLHLYREHRLAGLAPKERSDKYAHHGITHEMLSVIRGVRFSQPGFSIHAVYEAVRDKAQALGEPTPSEWQVRKICEEIAKPELLLAHKRSTDFRNAYEVTRRMEQTRRDSFLISYQIDHTQVDVLVKDKREHKKKSGEIRPWLTTCIDSRSRLLMSALFGYDRPDRHTVAAVIRDAVLTSEQKPYGGLPHEIWVDHGKELLSNHVYQLTEELNIQLQACEPHQPQQKGIVERFFGTLNTRLWSRQSGYVNSNTVKRDPNAKAELSLLDLEERFWAFIVQYHQETHSQTQESPLAYWTTHCYAEPADPRFLDVLLMERNERRVFKDGIHYRDRFYWHPDLPPLIGSDVLIRSAPIYRAPEEIEVFQDGLWICTALATDSDLSQGVTREEMGKAKQEQKGYWNSRIQEAREANEAVDREIADLQKDGTQPVVPPTSEPATPDPSSPTATSSQPPEAKSTPPPPSKPSRPRDLLERMAEQEQEEGGQGQ
jgi:putative transposase